MALRLVKKTQADDATAAVRVLLLDTPENLGVDFLQALQRQELKLVFERVNDKDCLFAALKQGNWDILLACDQVEVPGPEETLARLKLLNCETGYVALSKAELSIEILTSAYRKGIAAVVSARHPEFSLEVFAREAERSRRNLQLRLLNQEKFELKTHCQQLLSGTEEALAYLQDGIHVYGNEAYLKLLGYPGMEALMFMPFIDIVSAELRDKTKQRLLDFQHKVRMQPDSADLDIRELFLNGTGNQEGVLQMAATFKPVVYEGEACIQVVLKPAAGSQDREEPAAAEGLGYPLFVAHLDNFIAQARASDNLLGHVVHIRGSGFEHYIASRGFGSLNGKLKALASELKAGLGKDDVLIRFTESSFLALCKQDGSHSAAAPDPLETLRSLLARFESTLNKEAGMAAAGQALTLTFEVVPVDSHAVAADQLIKSFLSARSAAPAATEIAPQPELQSQPVQPQEPEQQSSNVIVFADKAPLATGLSGVGAAEPELTEVTLPEPVPCASIDAQRLTAALAGNTLELWYEVVISVSDIATEFHDLQVYLPGGTEAVSHAALTPALNAGTFAATAAGKLDQWALHKALAVIAGLYRQGQEYRVLLPLSARSLANPRLAEQIRTELKALGLPGQMLIVEFAITDLNSDVEKHCAQLKKLKDEGLLLCISGIRHIKDLKELFKLARADMVRLQRSFVEQAAASEAGFNLLRQSVEKLNAFKVKVFADDIQDSDELSLCCKAGIDLVKGKCIQKSPLALNGDSLAEAMAI